MAINTGCFIAALAGGPITIGLASLGLGVNALAFIAQWMQEGKANEVLQKCAQIQSEIVTIKRDKNIIVSERIEKESIRLTVINRFVEERHIRVVVPVAGDDQNTEDFVCPITHTIMADPVIVVSSGITYEKWAIEEWIRHHNTDPCTREVLTETNLVPNRVLKRLIERYLNNNF